MPFTPNACLYAMWNSQKHLSGYQQQDAHEYFISLLDEIHKKSGGEQHSCECVIHETFGGVLQSDLTCLECGVGSFTNDPFLDISLEIRNNTIKQASKKKKVDGGEVHISETSLQECLQEYLILIGIRYPRNWGLLITVVRLANNKLSNNYLSSNCRQY